MVSYRTNPTRSYDGMGRRYIGNFLTRSMPAATRVLVNQSPARTDGNTRITSSSRLLDSSAPGGFECMDTVRILTRMATCHHSARGGERPG